MKNDLLVRRAVVDNTSNWCFLVQRNKRLKLTSMIIEKALATRKLRFEFFDRQRSSFRL